MISECWKKTLDRQLDAAEAKFAEGEISAARNELDEVNGLVIDAITKLRSGDTLVINRKTVDNYQIEQTESHVLRDYKTRLKSVEALGSAFERVALDRGELVATEDVQRQFDENLKQASRLADKGDHQAPLSSWTKRMARFNKH